MWKKKIKNAKKSACLKSINKIQEPFKYAKNTGYLNSAEKLLKKLKIIYKSVRKIVKMSEKCK